MATTATSVPPRLLEFFVAEAVAYADTLREIMWLPASSRDTAKMLSAARGLRGASTMVRLSDLAIVAGHMERIAGAIHQRRIQWTEPLSYSLQAVLYELPELISSAGVWGAGEAERAAAIGDALHAFAPADDRKNSSLVLPITRLFHDDPGPHVLYVAVTPQTQFEQQLREPAPDKGDARAPAERPRRTTPDASASPEVADQRAPVEKKKRSRPTHAAPPAQHQRQEQPPTAGQERSTPRGQDLHSLISAGLAGFAGMELDAPAAASDTPGAGVVPIETLLYTGRAALARAREIRAAQAADGREPTPAELDELMDLMELATSG